MIFQNLKIAFRTLNKNKFQSLILIGGLTLGMTACLLLLQYVNYELSFDDFHSKKDNIYRVVNERIQEGTTVQKGTITYPTIGPTMQEEYPEIKNATRLTYSPRLLLKEASASDENAKVEQAEVGLWVDKHFFEVFDFDLLAGQRLNLMDEPNEIILTRKIADVLYPAAKGHYESIIGQELMVNRYADPFKVVAVAENVPSKSTLQFELLISYKSAIRYWGEGAGNSWDWSDFYHYLEIEPNTDIAALENKFVDFSDRHFRGTEVSGSEEIFTLQHLAKAHLNSNELEYEIGSTSSGRAVWALLIIAFFILVIAWINYVNLSSVRAIERSKEVGVRKVIGATRFQLVLQFLSEAFLVNFVSLLLAVTLVQFFNPWLANNFDVQLAALSFFSTNSFNAYLLFGLFGSIVLGILISGLYPAWLLSSPHVSNVLKGVFTKNLKGAGIRKGLVVFQFAMSIGLIVATWLVANQIRYMSQEDLGFNLDQVVVVEGPDLSQWDSTFVNRLNTFKGALEQFPTIISATTSGRRPGETMGRNFNVRKSADGENGPSFTSNTLPVDSDFARTYDFKPIAGRFLRKEDHNIEMSQIKSLVINEAAVRTFRLGSSEEAIGQQLQLYGQDWDIVGVVPDFHQLSLHHIVEPMILLPLYGTGHYISLRTGGDQIDATLAQVKSTYDDFFPGNRFEYSFADEQFKQLYEADQRFGNILSFFTILAILIACFGLFGLASYTTFLRTKEIGVRKVLGASSTSIITLLSKDFIQLVVIAFFIAAPLTWLGVTYWLDNFAYHINIQWWVFAIAGIVTVGITFLTVGLQGVRAALSNPVESLRSE